MSCGHSTSAHQRVLCPENRQQQVDLAGTFLLHTPDQRRACTGELARKAETVFLAEGEDGRGHLAAAGQLLSADACQVLASNHVQLAAGMPCRCIDAQQKGCDMPSWAVGRLACR